MNGSGRAWAGAGLIGLLLAGVLLWSPWNGGPIDRPGAAGASGGGEPMDGLGRPGGPGEGGGGQDDDDADGSKDGSSSEQDEAGGAADAGDDGPGAGRGPVGTVTSADLKTIEIPAPAGGVALVAPRFSPDGSRVMATSGRHETASVWLADVREDNRTWVQMPGDAPLSDPTWVGSDRVAAVRDGKLVIWQVGQSELKPLLDEADEPGHVRTPAGTDDGKQLAYIAVTGSNGGGDLRVLTRSSGVVRDVIRTPALVAHPNWRRDGEAVVATVSGVPTAWSMGQSDPLRSMAGRNGRNPGWWGDALYWQEGPSLLVNLVIAPPDGPPRVIVRGGLASLAHPAPVGGGRVWLSSVMERGTLWAVDAEGNGVVLATDAPHTTQPDVVQRADGLWVAFTSTGEGNITRIRLAKVDPALLE